MNFSNFITWLLGIYLVYYAVNFLYDGFIKKTGKKDLEDDEVMAFVGDINQEEPKTVEKELREEIVENPDISSQEKKIAQEEEVGTPIMQEPVVMEVETQAIPYNVLMGDSKHLFAGIF